ncbi:HAMP domain-containing protein [Baaleninema simplex]|uniref:HAMP domain-containing protein n=1 Tax=Baaleninema simplex TaxID=2862350 RepID=UPI001181B526|nr:HAMP domain-containing protein [Baaleninema simplex]
MFDLISKASNISRHKNMFRSILSQKSCLKYNFSRLNIGQKIAIGYIIGIGVAALGTTGGHLIAETFIEKPAFQIRELEQKKFGFLTEIKDSVLESKSTIVVYLKNPELLENYSYYLIDRSQQIEELILEFEKFAFNELQSNDIDSHLTNIELFLKEHQETISQYQQELKNVLKKIENDKTLDIESRQKFLLEFANSEEALALDRMNRDLTEIIRESRQLELEEDAKLRRARNLENQVIQISLIVSIALAIVLCIYTSLEITRPLKKVTQVAWDAAENGNFDRKASIDTKDEIGTLVQRQL